MYIVSVDSDTGQVCADFLDDLSCWKEFYSISYMLLSIQVSFSTSLIIHEVKTKEIIITVSEVWIPRLD